MGRRRLSREFALQLLFEVEITRDPPADVAERFWGARPAAQDVRQFAERLALGTLRQLEEIDGILAAAAEHWRLDRMAVVDRNVLRMAIYELHHHRETPAAVVIDEAIEVARKYGSAESGTFINGILDAVRQRFALEGNAT